MIENRFVTINQARRYPSLFAHDYNVFPLLKDIFNYCAILFSPSTMSSVFDWL